MKTKVKISKNGTVKILNLDMAKMFLELCGGGLSVSQTARAIDLNREFNGAGAITFNGFSIEKIK